MIPSFFIRSVRLVPVFLAAVAVGMPAAADISWDQAYDKASRKLKELTLEEKLHFVRGYSEFFFYGVPEKGIPFLYHSDATGGVNIRRNLPDSSLVIPLERSTAMPAPIMLAATFDQDLAERYGKAVGEECRAGGIEVLLGPGINISRNSQCGRNFEYFGEDPTLTSDMCASYVSGLQSTGTAACLKHFICNETEFYRRRSNSVVDERALHEVYMKPFEAGIKAGAGFVMASYNQLNGEWTGQNKWLLTDVLRNEMGFKGAIVSDWSSVYDTSKVVASGLNTEMPGRLETIPEIKELLANERINEADIDAMILPCIATGYKYGFYDRPKYLPELLDKYREHADLAREVAGAGTVLLKNNGILPLKQGLNILVVGEFIDEVPRTGDNPAASAAVKGYDNVTLREAMRQAFGDNVVFTVSPSDDDIVSADVVLVSVGTIDMESFERPFKLPDRQERLIKRTVGQNDNTVVLVNSGSGVRMSDWADNVAAIIYGWYPGQNGISAIVDIIRGAINPSGKLPITIERDFKDSPALHTMPPGSEFYNNAYRAYNEKLISVFDVNYDESVFVGYKWYENKGISPLFPFGYGLSYTSFILDNPEVEMKNGKICISVGVRNTGSMAGSETIQVYVSEDSPTVDRPIKELKGYSKISLKPGHHERVKVMIEAASLGFWDVTIHSWRRNPGKYTFHIGTSSINIPFSISKNIK